MSAIIANSIWTPLLALDRLNSWVRSKTPTFCRPRSTFTPVIYWVKTQAILWFSKREHISMRRVMVDRPCLSCGGTGVWTPWWGDCDCCESKDQYLANHGEICLKCRGAGKVTLRFVETQIGPVRWHTPAEKWYMSSLDVYVPFPSFYGADGLDYYAPAEGWGPNRPGRAMTYDQVERDMVLVLRQWPHDVAFSIDFHYHVGLEPRHGYPDVAKAETWIRDLIAVARPFEAL